MDEFVKSKVIMSPGAAGATTVMITGTLVSQFDLPPQAWGLWICLACSILFGLTLSMQDKGAALISRIASGIVNSATVFAVAVGLNQAGIEMTKTEEQLRIERQIERQLPRGVAESRPFFQKWF